MYHAAPMQATIACLEMARRLTPPQAIIHVGAGYGQGALHQWQHWQVPQARVIDAERERLQWLQDVMARQDVAGDTANWQALQAVVAEHEGPVELHTTNHRAEDGLMDAHALKSIWPNLRTLTKHTKSAQTLDSVLSQHPLHNEQPALTALTAPLLSTRSNWLMVECLPALRVLQGAIQTLDTVSTVCLRVLISADTHPDHATTSANLETATAFLATHGFTCVHVGETNHPAVGEAIFMHSDAPSLRAECATLHQLVAQLQKQCQEKEAALAQCHEPLQKLELQTQAHQALEADLAQKLQTLSDANAALETALAQNAELHQHKAALQRAQDELTAARAKEKAQLQQKIELQRQAHQALEADLAQKNQALSDANAALETALAQNAELHQHKAALQRAQNELTAARANEQAQLQQKIELQTQAHQALEADLAQKNQALSDAQNQITQLNQDQATLQEARDEQTRLASACQQQLEEHKKTIAENQYRQQLMQEEMIKADAQLELIKELLLRESDL